MKRSTLLPMLIALACLLAVVFASPGEAKAQCCGMQYDVRVSGLSALCPSVTVTANFDGGVTSHTFTSNGNYLNLPYLATSFCPTFNWISLDGGSTTLGPGQSGTLYSTGTCCFFVTVTLTTSPCRVLVTIAPPFTPC